MAQPQDLVDRAMDVANTVANAMKEVDASVSEYNALGGDTQELAAFFAGHTDGKFRGVTKGQFVDGVAALMAIVGAFDSNKTNLTRIRGR